MARAWPGTLWRNRDGAATVMLAISFTTLMGAAAVGVDVGALFLAKRQLQGIADAAVLAAATGDMANGATASAQSVIDRSGQPGVAINRLARGIYRRDAMIAPAARFVETGAQPSAAQLVIERPVPIFFGRFLTGKATTMVRAQATAARTDLAAFSIGTGLAALSGGLPNQLLSALAGTQLNLSVMDGQSLAAANVDILGFADALRVQLGRQGSSYADIFGTDIPLQSLVRAMAEAAPDIASRTVLATITPRLGTGRVRLADLIDLGPLGQNDVHDGDAPIKVDAFTLLRALLESAQGDVSLATLNIVAAGLADAKLTLVTGGGDARSPWMTVTQARDVVIRTSRTRLYLEVSALGDLVPLHIPVYVDLAEAQARLADIQCGGNPASDGVTLAVTPSIGTVAITDLTAAQLKDFSRAPTMPPAVLANVPINLLGTKISARAEAHLGGVAPRNVYFDRNAIASRTPITIATNDLAAGITRSLVKDVDISVTVLGITTRVGPIVSTVGAQLGLLAPLIDGVLNQVTGLLGLQLGAATTRVDRMRCGVPTLVA
ncbi:MAG TPA: pilus assembly protein TadG-related protein [Sphingobium sp.]|nr:pilus assembly protein TadG-related protein [Sphingobium sp.]